MMVLNIEWFTSIRAPALAGVSTGRPVADACHAYRPHARYAWGRVAVFGVAAASTGRDADRIVTAQDRRTRPSAATGRHVCAPAGGEWRCVWWLLNTICSVMCLPAHPWLRAACHIDLPGLAGPRRDILVRRPGRSKPNILGLRLP